MLVAVVGVGVSLVLWLFLMLLLLLVLLLRVLPPLSTLRWVCERWRRPESCGERWPRIFTSSGE